MRNLIAYLRWSSRVLVFLALQFVALWLYFHSLDLPHVHFMDTANTVQGSINSWENDWSKHFSLEDENAQLITSNSELMGKLPYSYYPMEGDMVRINDTVYKQQFEYIGAQVVNVTTSRRNNFMTLEAGNSRGIEEGMGVTSDDGIIGVVVSVSSHYSLVKTLLSKDPRLDAEVEPSMEFGNLEWDGKDPRFVQMRGIPLEIEIDEGSVVKTRGSSGIFPRGLMVGHVNEVERPIEEQQLNIHIQLSCNMRTVRHAYVIRNRMKDEQAQLENSIIE